MKEAAQVLYIGLFICLIMFLFGFGTYNLCKALNQPYDSPTIYTVVTEYGTYPGIRHKPYKRYVDESGKEHDFHGSYTMVEE